MDPPAVRVMHDKHKPEVHVNFDIGPDEITFDHEPTESELS
jgi:hypothetical protein